MILKSRTLLLLLLSASALVKGEQHDLRARKLCNACDAPEITFDPENNFVATVSGDTTGTAQQLSPGACGQGGNNQGLWYKFRANGHYIRATTCDPNTNYDTWITVMATSTDSCDQLSCVTSNDDDSGCSNRQQSSVAFETSTVGWNYILVHGYPGNSPTGRFTLHVTDETAQSQTPTDNSCQTPAVELPDLPDGDGGVVLNGDTTNAPFVTTPDGQTVQGLWYKVRSIDFLYAETCDPQTNFDTQISVYSAEGGMERPDLDGCPTEFVIHNDDRENPEGCGVDPTHSGVVWWADIDKTYWILVYGYQGQTGQFALRVGWHTSYFPCHWAQEVSTSDSMISGSVDYYNDPGMEMHGVWCGDNPTGGAWYKFVGPPPTGGEAAVIVSVCGANADDVVKVAIYGGDTCNNLVCLTPATSASGCVTSSVETVENEMYWLLIYGYEETPVDFTLSFSRVSVATAPSN